MNSDAAPTTPSRLASRRQALAWLGAAGAAMAASACGGGSTARPTSSADGASNPAFLRGVQIADAAGMNLGVRR